MRFIVASHLRRFVDKLWYRIERIIWSIISNGRFFVRSPRHSLAGSTEQCLHFRFSAAKITSWLPCKHVFPRINASTLKSSSIIINLLPVSVTCARVSGWNCSQQSSDVLWRWTADPVNVCNNKNNECRPLKLMKTLYFWVDPISFDQKQSKEDKFRKSIVWSLCC